MIPSDLYEQINTLIAEAIESGMEPETIAVLFTEVAATLVESQS